MSAPEPMLSLRNVSLRFGGLLAVDDATFDVPSGRVTSLIGPNGAGKTTIFNIITGVLRAQRGRVRFGDIPIENRPPYVIAGLGIGRTFQAPRVFAEMSVIGNVMVGMRRPGENPLRSILRGPAYAHEAKETRLRSEEILAEVGLLSRAHDPAGSLSFGEQRFLSIARAVVSKPALILMDEPTVGLHGEALTTLTERVVALISSYGATLLLIEHHMETVMSISHKVILLVQGHVVVEGTPDEVRNSPSMLNAYLGVKTVA